MLSRNALSSWQKTNKHWWYLFPFLLMLVKGPEGTRLLNRKRKKQNIRKCPKDIWRWGKSWPKAYTNMSNLLGSDRTSGIEIFDLPMSLRLEVLCDYRKPFKYMENF